MMLRATLVAALLSALLAAAPAAAETCTSAGDGSWSGSPPNQGISWAGCTPTADDTFVIDDDTVTVDAQLGASGSELTGGITVQSGGDLRFAQPETAYIASEIEYQNGSDGDLAGGVLDSVAVPARIAFPDSTSITLDWQDVEEVLPWALCDPTGAAATCGDDTVHPADTDPGEEQPPTYLYFEWEKANATGARRIAPGGHLPDPVYDPGLWLEVTAVADTSGSGTFDTVTLALPTLGPTEGYQYFGAPSGVAPDGAGRCPYCIEDPAGGDQPYSAATTGADVSGEPVRNAIGEGNWTVDSAGIRRNANDERRYEVRIDAADTPFADDREFEGWLACLPTDQTTFDPATEQWCARIIKTKADAHSTTGELFTVWNDPRGHVRAGDELNVYYARPKVGDKVTPVNPVVFEGAGGFELLVQEDSQLCRSADCEGILFRANNGSVSIGIEFQNMVDWNLDLVLVEHTQGTNPSFTGIGLEQQTHLAQASNWQASRISCRFPDVDSFADDPTNPNVPGGQCIDLFFDDSTGGALRKIRCEGYHTCHAGSSAQGYDACPDDLWLQDMLAYNARSVRDRTLGSHNYELLEQSYGTPTCGTDRVAVVGTLDGVPYLTRAEQGSPWTATSVAAFGVADPGTSSSTGRAISGNNAQSTLFKTVNYVASGRIDVVPLHYGAILGYAPDGDFGQDFWGFGQCRSSVGNFSYGHPINAAVNSVPGCVEGSTVEVLDNVVAGYSTSQIAALALRDNGVNASLKMLRNLLVARNDLTGNDPTWLNLDANDGGSLDLTVSGVHLYEGATTADTAYAIAATDHVGQSTFGPNLYLGGRDLRCVQLSSGTYWQTNEGCVVADANTPSGDGVANTGWAENLGWSGELRGDERGATLLLPEPDPSELPAACTNAASPDPGASVECSVADALPRWAGPVAYDWPFAWSTLDPVPGFRRAAPLSAYVPKYLRERGGFEKGGVRIGPGLELGE